MPGRIWKAEESLVSPAPSFAYIPALDGLRAVSIALVMLSHFGFGAFVPGIFGVTIFFFVSGFLITRQLLCEVGATGSLRLDMFYLRRVLRLYPALIAIVAASAIVFPALGGRMATSDVVWALFYGTNYHAMAGGNQSGIPLVPHPFAILWSLAVEEHYYLAFPLIVWLFGRSQERLAVAIAILILAVTAWRFHVVGYCADHPAIGFCAVPFRIEHGTDTRVDSIFYGALLATLLGSRWSGTVLASLRSPIVFAAGAVALLASFLIRDGWFRDTLRFSVQGMGLFICVGTTLYAAFLAPIRSILARTVAILVGRWSYSLYLWHWPVFSVTGCLLPIAVWVPFLHGAGSLGWTVMLFPTLTAVSLALAVTSYYGIERPMVALRRRFGSHAVADRGPGAPARQEAANSPLARKIDANERLSAGRHAPADQQHDRLDQVLDRPARAVHREDDSRGSESEPAEMKNRGGILAKNLAKQEAGQ
jgi:peptidoglycan/LPS O-acetylase OafA/YrhL